MSRLVSKKLIALVLCLTVVATAGCSSPPSYTLEFGNIQSGNTSAGEYTIESNVTLTGQNADDFVLKNVSVLFLDRNKDVLGQRNIGSFHPDSSDAHINETFSDEPVYIMIKVSEVDGIEKKHIQVEGVRKTSRGIWDIYSGYNPYNTTDI